MLIVVKMELMSYLSQHLAFKKIGGNMNKPITLDSVIDMHVHTAPDICARTYNDLELTLSAVRSNARAIVIKGHHSSTVARASICNAYNKSMHGCNSFTMFGGLVLNYEAGGFNPRAVQTALEMGAKIIWLPTVDAQNEYQKRGKAGGLCVFDEKSAIKSELREIFSLIKNYNVVLATGHISPKESLLVAEEAREIGVEKIVITHPEYWIVDMSIETQRKLVSDFDVVLERCFMQPLKTGKWIDNSERNLEAIKELGTSNTILSTDCGNPATPPWEKAMLQYLTFMSKNDICEEDINKMTRELPSHLLGLGEKE